MNLQSSLSKDIFTSDAKLSLHLHIHLAYSAFCIINEETCEINFISVVESSKHTKEIDIDELKTWLKKNQSEFNFAYHSVRVLIHSNKFSLVGNSENEAKNAFKLLNDFDENDEVILEDKINDQLTISYAIRKKIHRLLSGNFDKKSIHFGDLGFIQALVANKANLSSTFLACQIIESDLSIAVFKDQNLLFFNKFQIKNSEDLLYYLLLTYQSHNLDASQIPLYLSGLIEKNSPMFQLIFDYIRTIHFLNTIKEFTYPKTINDLPKHYFFNLINAATCE